MTASADPSTRFVLSKDAPLLANMAAMWASDPALAEELEGVLGEEPYGVEASKAGAPTLSITTAEGRRVTVHSRYNPEDEAARLIGSVAVEENAVFCVQGFGLGYHVEALFERASRESLVFVFEPDLRMIRTALEHRDLSKMIESGRVVVLARADHAELMRRLGDRQATVAAGLSIVSHTPSIQLHEAFYREVETWIGQFVDYCRTNINTLVLNGRRTAENIARNIGWYVSTPSITRLKGRHRGSPAVIVSAGPSLRKNKHLLKEAAEGAVLIAVQTTLQPLVEMGIEPRYVTSLDYHDICTRFFEKLPKGLKTELVAEPKASSAIFAMHPGPVSLLGNDFADKLLREVKLDKDRLRAGATVAHLAFYLAEYMGCDPIVFVGQDLGFSDGLCYTPGTSYEDVWRPELGRFCTVEMKQWEHIARERPILRKIADWEGRPMYTEQRLFVYLQQFERDFATSPARVIDATEGGAAKRGATPMALREAMDRFCSKELEAGAAEYPERRKELLAEAVASLRRRREEAGQIAEISRQTLELLNELKACIEDQGRANRLIARVDALRAQIGKLNDCYELVTELAQPAQVQRFKADHRIAAAHLNGVELQRRQIDRDILNVQSVLDAAGEFQGLMDEVIERIGR